MESFIKILIWLWIISVIAVEGNVKTGRQCLSSGMVRCDATTGKLDQKTTCVHQRQICNKVEDCPNAEDEVNCVDKAGDDDGVHNILEKKIPLLKNFYRCMLESPPEFCRCRQDTLLTCQFANLTKVPQYLDTSITQLLIGNNQIILESWSFQRYSHLTHVQLDGNNLSYLPENVFSENKHINRLFLNNNSLSNIPCKIGNDLDKLSKLYLNKNLFTVIDPILNCFSGLIDLHADSNNINLQNRLQIKSHPKLKALSLENNKIEKIRPEFFNGLIGLTSLYLRGNIISEIHPNSFSELTKLRFLDLSHNKIHSLDSSMFSGASSLATLEFISNKLLQVEETTFNNLASLESLNLRDIELSERVLINLTNISVNHIHFKRFRYCSYLPEIRDCRPKTDGVSSFNQLLISIGLRVTVWVVAAITIIGNLIVLHGRTISRDDNKVVSLFIRNLAVADLLTGCYVLVIAIKDQIFRDRYHIHAFEWMNSWDCTITGIIGMLASEASVLLLSVMSVERCICITCPLKTPLLTAWKAKWILAILWTFAAIISLIPVGVYRQRPRFYGSNGMCFPMHLDDPWVPGWKYSALIFVGLNQIGMIAIALSYGAMFYSIRRTRANTPLALGDREFALRFFFIVLTDCFCWIPIIILKIIALFDGQIRPDVYAFVVVILLPINSAINPWLYTFTTYKFRSQFGRYARHWRPKFNRADSESEVTRTSFLKSSKKISFSGRGSHPSLADRLTETAAISAYLQTVSNRCSRNGVETREIETELQTVNALIPDSRQNNSAEESI